MSSIESVYLPPDLYSRNYIIAQGISALKSQLGLKNVKILDVGGLNGQIGEFIDKLDEVTILDIRKGPEPNLVVGDGTRMSMFKDQSFDIVISSDVLEHIPKDRREDFFSEACRVAKYMVAVAAPFNSKEVALSEKHIRDFFKEIVGYEHQWLNEHNEMGLPDKDEFEKRVLDQGLSFTRVGSNSINNWLLIQLFDILKFSFGCSENDVRDIHKFYNDHVKYIENPGDPFYRYIYFVTKEKNTFSFDYTPEIEFQYLYEIKVLNLLNKYFTEIKDLYIGLIETFREKESALVAMELTHKEHAERIAVLQQTLQEKESALVAMELTNREQAERIAVLQQTLREKELALVEMEPPNREQAERIAVLQQNIRELEQAIREIQSTRAWKVVNFFGYPYSRLQHYAKSINQEITDKGIINGLHFSFYLFLTRIVKISRLRMKQIGFSSVSMPNIPAEQPVSPRIILLSGCPGDAMRYRVFHQQEQLLCHGISADSYDSYEIDTHLALDKYDIFILHRVPITPEYEKLILEGKKQGKIFIFETDDLVFDEKYGKYIRALNEMTKEQIELYYDGLRRFKATMFLCDYAICSTEYLKRELEGYGKVVYMNENSVSDEMVRLSDEARNKTPSKSNDEFLIGYLSGTKTHNIDFKEAEDALLKILREFGHVKLVIGGHLDLSEKFSEFSSRIVRLPFMDWQMLPDHIIDFDINICPLENSPFCQAKSDLKYFEAALLKVPTIASNVGGYATHLRNCENGMLVSTSDEWYEALKLLITNESFRVKIGSNAYDDVMANRTTYAVGFNLVKILEDIKSRNKTRKKASKTSEFTPKYPDNKWPSFSIISILYNKEREVNYFLESFISQRYKGEYEIIFVDDCSTDHSVQVVTDFVEKAKVNRGSVRVPDVRIIRNTENTGNCTSRNTGIKNAKGDIIVVIDADCIVNKDFLKSHAQSYLFDDYNVSIGPINLETNGREPFEVLSYYETNPHKVEDDSLLQDNINKRSFINCITRNFSVKRNFITEDLFDPEFSYSKKSSSGFGWEDVEMGYRLYLRDARINYTSDAFSIHISHPPAIEDKYKPAMSIRNFRKLYEKHPELFYTSRRWTLDTYPKITNWLDSYLIKNNEDREYLDKKFQRFLPPPYYNTSKNSGKELKILTYRWHCAHQYEIFKLPHEFTLVTGLGTGITGYWEYDRRPLPENVSFEQFDNINVKDYDLAIVHFDEMVLTPENSNSIITPEMRWGDSFRWFLKNVDIPKVGICHGTPQFYGQYNIDYNKSNLMQPIAEERQKFRDILGDTLVITNSHQAQKEWNFKNSKVIWHGLDPTEFPPATYEKGILVMGEKAMRNRPHYNGYLLYNEIMRELPTQYSPEHLSVPEPDKAYGNNNNYYARSKFNNYVRELGKYSIYLNSTLRSPMPRTRAEAMMCGLATVSAKNHDVELFIKNGVNGFYSDKPHELRDYLLYLCENPEIAREIGEAGRQTAMDLFNHDRFLMDWEKTIKYVLG